MVAKGIRFIEAAVAVALTVAVMVLIFERFQSPGSIWRDEVASLQLATSPSISDIWGKFEHEAFPPPFPLLVREYTSLFGSELATLKAFGLIVSTGLVAAIWIFSLTVLRGPPLIALSLLGLNSAILIWCGALRGYGLSCVAIVLAFTAICYVLRAPSYRRLFLAWLLLSFSLQWSLQNCVVVFALIVAAVLASLCCEPVQPRVEDKSPSIQLPRRGWTRLGLAWALLICGGLSAFTILPYLPSYLKADWKVLIEGNETLLDYFWGLVFDVGQPLAWMQWVWGALIICVLVTAIVIVARWKHVPRHVRSQVLFGLFSILIVVPVFLLFLLHLKYRPRPWYFLPVLVTLACSIQLALSSAWNNTFARVAQCGFAVTLTAALFNADYQLLDYRLTNLDLATSIVNEQAKPDDLVVVTPWFYGVGFQWHYHGTAPWDTLPSISDHSVHRYDLVKARMLETHPLKDLKTRILETYHRGGDVWIVGHLHAVPANGPTVFKTAPDPEVGWSENFYVMSWMEQLTDFIKSNSSRIDEIPVTSDEPVASAEQIRVWQTRAPRNP